MRERRPSPAAVAGFFGIGDPLSAEGERPELPYARRSLERIGAMFPEGERTVLCGANATKQALRATPLERYRYLHFATHGWLDPDAPQHFGLRLSPAGEDGGLLYLDEIFSLRLGAELVVLAACESGRGELVGGEGLVSVARAFLYAGARSLVVSLWEVGDRSTAELMEAFYAELRQGRPVPDALRRTKLAFIHSDRVAQRQPFRWAPFVLIGDPGAPEPNPGVAQATSLREAR
jgi:CHAT domain-containing protein